MGPKELSVVRYPNYGSKGTLCFKITAKFGHRSNIWDKTKALVPIISEVIAKQLRAPLFDN